MFVSIKHMEKEKLYADPGYRTNVVCFQRVCYLTC